MKIEQVTPQQLKKGRINAGLTQQALADLTGFTITTIAMLESGRLQRGAAKWSYAYHVGILPRRSRKVS